ncbi:ScbR family autoregulator-binding transcription factor [Streptomyces carpaticus]|uniref:ScbR family autoregulator-binding transcription factor n=1 Tax=Streptomyces carpaticus TaxID=285558 RepID=UPI0031F82337
MALQERAVRTRETVLRAASEAFAAKGFLGTSMAEILDLAQVTKGALYFHFGSKEELAASIIAEQEKAARRVVETVVAESAPPLDKVVAITVRWAHTVQTDPQVRAGARLMTEWRGPDGGPMAPYGWWQGVIRDLLAEARERGDLHPRVDIDLAAEFVVSSFTCSQSLWGILCEHPDLSGRVRSLWQLLLTGMLADEHRAPATGPAPVAAAT